jgi:hypothetical protein
VLAFTFDIAAARALSSKFLFFLWLLLLRTLFIYMRVPLCHPPTCLPHPLPFRSTRSAGPSWQNRDAVDLRLVHDLLVSCLSPTYPPRRSTAPSVCLKGPTGGSSFELTRSVNLQRLKPGWKNLELVHLPH